MANWFKLYETDLDETRMRFALTKLPEAWPVWTGILMECCKHRKGTIRWGDNEQELFGFADRLKISIPKVNLAIAVLCEIEYIKKGVGVLNVLKWNEKQNDYLQRASRGYWKNHSEKKKVTVNNCDSHIEERRGEEKRLDKSTKEGGSFKVPKETYSPESRSALYILNELTGKKFREMESSLGPINARMREEDVTLEGVTLMINRQCKLWKGTKFEEYLRPSTLFGKEKFNEYYAAREQPINRADSVRSNPRNEGVIVGVTDYATAKPRAQREREEAEAAMVGQVAPDAPHPPPSRDSLQSGLQSLLAIRQDAING